MFPGLRRTGRAVTRLARRGQRRLRQEGRRAGKRGRLWLSVSLPSQYQNDRRGNGRRLKKKTGGREALSIPRRLVGVLRAPTTQHAIQLSLSALHVAWRQPRCLHLLKRDAEIHARVSIMSLFIQLQRSVQVQLEINHKTMRRKLQKI